MLVSLVTKVVGGSELVFRFGGHHSCLCCGGGGATGQRAAINSQPLGANFGSEVIRFPHRVHMILAQLLKR